MTRDELERLLWERLDGTVSAADLARLEARLAADPEARAEAERVRALGARLAELPPVEPPADLAPAIARAVAERAASPSRAARQLPAWTRVIRVTGTKGEEIMNASSRRWAYALGAAAVVVVAIVALFLVTQPPTPSEQATGTIGAAERYRAEQIKEGDVGLEAPAEVTGPVTDEELAGALAQAPLEIHAALGLKIADDQLLANLGKIPAEFQAQLFERFTPQQLEGIKYPAAMLVRVFERLEPAARGPVLQQLKVNPADWEKFSHEMKEKSFERLPGPQQMALVKSFDLNEKAYGFMAAAPALKLEALRNAPAEVRATYTSRFPLEGRMMLVRSADTGTRAKLEERAHQARKAAADLGRAPFVMQMQMLDRANRDERGDLIGHFQAEHMVAIVGRGPAAYQEAIFARALPTEHAYFYDRAEPAIRQALAVRAPAEMLAHVLNQMEANVRSPILEKFEVSAADWAKFTPEAQKSFVERNMAELRVPLSEHFTVNEKSYLFQQAPFEEKFRMAKSAPDLFGAIFARSSMDERVNAYDLATAQEKLAMLRVAPTALRAEMWGRFEKAGRGQQPSE